MISTVVKKRSLFTIVHLCPRKVKNELYGIWWVLKCTDTHRLNSHMAPLTFRIPGTISGYTGRYYYLLSSWLFDANLKGENPIVFLANFQNKNIFIRINTKITTNTLFTDGLISSITRKATTVPETNRMKLRTSGGLKKLGCQMRYCGFEITITLKPSEKNFWKVPI